MPKKKDFPTWFNPHFPPYEPSNPVEPLKTLTVTEELSTKEFPWYTRLQKDDLEEIIQHYLAINAEELAFSTNDDSLIFRFMGKREIEKTKTDYQKEKKRYNRNLSKYQKEHAEWQKRSAEWKELKKKWDDQAEQERMRHLERELAKLKKKRS